MGERIAGSQRRRAMWHALNRFIGNEGPMAGRYVEWLHPVRARRALRMFEEENGIPFDPLVPTHMRCVHNMRPYLVMRQHFSPARQ